MIKWGIIGFGNMGRKFFETFKDPHPKIELAGIASTSKSYKINVKKSQIKFFDNYQDLIKDNNINAVYIATLNQSHKQLVLLALKHNKKILCEKPLGLNSLEIKEINNEIKLNNILFEAIAYRSHPLVNDLKKLIKELPEFGMIKKIESNFGFKVKKIKKSSRLFNKDLGGGSILDLGCYPISFFNLFNKKKMKIFESKLEQCETGVDISGEINLLINDIIEANAKVSFKENLENVCKIYFDNGIIKILEPWLPSKNVILECETKTRYFKKFVKSNLNVYSHQLNKISEVFLENDKNSDNLVKIEESLLIHDILDKWKKN